MIWSSACAQPQYFHYQTCNIPLRSRQMLHTMLWAPFSLSTATPWPIIVIHYQMLSISTLLMTRKCTPLWKPVTNGEITILGRRHSSTLIISHYSSCRHKANYKMTTIKSSPHTYNNSTSTSSIKHEAPICRWLPQQIASRDTHHGARLLRRWDLWMAPNLWDKPKVYHHLPNVGCKRTCW